MLADPYPELQSGAGSFVQSSDFAGEAAAAALVNAIDRIGAAANGKVNFSISQAATRLTGGEGGWGVLGQPFTVSYAFRSTAPNTMPEDTSGFQRFSTAQIDQAELALRAWSDVANIRFVRVGVGDTGEAAYSNSASILFSDYTAGAAGASAFGNFPGSTSAGSADGDIWVNASLSYNANPTSGNYGGQVLVHELGHAIGLDHPSSYDATTDSNITYAVDASYFEDSRQYTVMSYFSETNTGADYRGLSGAAPMLDDIAAAQMEYGANMSTRTGDTVYGFHSNADQPWFIATSSASKLIFAVWDAGGVNTFDFSGYANNQLIDLRQGNFSNVGGLTGNVAIALGTNIRSAIGGSGADVINGNSLGDTMSGGVGNDTLSSGNGANYLRGDDGADSIQGGSGFDDINGNKGEDTIVGGSGGGDWLVGGQGNDLITSQASDDILYGNLGNDTLNGGSGNEIIRGGQGDDVLSGGAGADWLSGDRGSDTVTGGPGADIFHSFSGAGLDVVTDFHLSEGDRVQLDPGTTYTTAQSGADTVIDMGGGDRMVLQAVQLSSLTGAWIFIA